MPREASLKANLTYAYCAGLKKAEKRYRVTDKGLPILKLMVEPSGRKFWRYRYGAAGEITLGEFDDMLVEEARDLAREAQRLAKAGKNPAEVRREAKAAALEQKAQTFTWLSELYMKASESGAFSGKNGKKAETTLAKERQYLNKHVNPRIGSKPLAEIKRATIVGALEEIATSSGYGAANSSLEVIRRVFAYGRHKDLIENNPAVEIKSYKSLPRDVVATDEAIRKLWLALEGAKADRLLKDGGVKPSEGYASAVALQLSLLTLQRRGEVVRINRRDVDFGKSLWVIPSANKKERRKGAVPLSPWAVEILKRAFERSGSEWAFPAVAGKGRSKEPQVGHMDPHTLSRFMARLRAGAGAGYDKAEKAARKEAFQDITVHDLRRTGRTKLTGEELQIDPVTAERVLNHVVGSRQQRTYDWNDYVGPKRVALEAWAKELRRIVYGEEPASNVVSFNGAASAG